MLSEVHGNTIAPTCPKCGALMVPNTSRVPAGAWKCLSCGAKSDPAKAPIAAGAAPPPICKCGHTRSQHAEEQNYECYAFPNKRLPWRCPCTGYSPAPPAAPLAQSAPIVCECPPRDQQVCVAHPESRPSYCRIGAEAKVEAEPTAEQLAKWWWNAHRFRFLDAWPQALAAYAHERVESVVAPLRAEIERVKSEQDYYATVGQLHTATEIIDSAFGFLRRGDIAAAQKALTRDRIETMPGLTYGELVRLVKESAGLRQELEQARKSCEAWEQMAVSNNARVATAKAEARQALAQELGPHMVKMLDAIAELKLPREQRNRLRLMIHEVRDAMVEAARQPKEDATMRVNVYAEEMTDRVEIISKEIDGTTFTGLRFYLELPCTVNGQNVSGPFMHRPGDDDSAAVTFWGKRDLRQLLVKALAMLDEHYDSRQPKEDASG